MSELPLITIGVSAYNRENFLPECLDSLLAQSYPNTEIIVVDDGSKDNTYEVALENQRNHPNIALLRNEQNLGLNATLNKCLAVARGEYIARMDGDDISLPTRFEKQVKFLDEHPEYAVVSAPMIYFDENGEFRRGTGKGEVDAKDFVHGSPICHAPCMARTTVFNAVGGYSVDEKLLRAEDYHLWFKIFAAGYKLYMMNECLYKMRDDRNATARRNWLTRRNECYVKHIGYKMIGLSFYYQIFAVVPILKYFAPRFVYDYFHRK
jgi:glycosyltransferase EpsE